jgi:multiple sugar transport system substrate-binding protein
MRQHLVGLGLLAGLVGAAVTAQSQKVEITYVHGFTGPDRPFMENLVKKWNDENPNIQVKSQAVPWGTTYQQLPSLTAAGRAPDVVAYTEEVVGYYMASNAITPITSAMLRTYKIDSKRYYKALWDAGVYKGKVYGVPINNALMVMFYNKDLLAKSGAKVPKNRAEYLETAKACTIDRAGKKPGQDGFDAKALATWGAGVPTPWMGGTLAYGVLRGNGGDIVDKKFDATFNSPEAVEAVQFLVDLRLKSGTGPSDATEGSEITAFRQGKVCFNFNGIWTLSQFQGQQGLNFGAAPLPQFGTKRAATWGASVQLGVPRHNADYDKAKLDAGLKFIAWMTMPEQNLAWTESGSVPTQPTVSDNAKFKDNVIGETFEGLKDTYIPTGWPWVSQVRGSWDGALEQALLGKKPVQQALDDGVAEAAKKIADAKKTLGVK